MKTPLALCALCLAFPLGLSATTLTVNQPLEQSLIDAQTLSIQSTPQVGEGAVLVLKAEVAFTLPDESPDYADVIGEKLALAVDTDGTVLIADGATQSWVKSSVVAQADTPVSVYAEGKLQAGVLVFAVTLDDTAPITVRAPASGAKLNAIELAGEGVVEEGLTLALVDTAIIPGSAEAPQEAALVNKYVTWVNDAGKGGKMPEDATSEEIADAFAMNAGSATSVEITALDIVNKTLTLRATAAADDGSAETVLLTQINGKLYLLCATDLTAEPTVTEISLQDGSASVQNSDGDTLTILLPESEATFFKAAVSLRQPEAETL